MLMNWGNAWRIKRIVREAARDRVREQALCPHNWHRIGERVETVYNGYDVDYVNKYMIGCSECGAKKEFYEKDYAEAEVFMSELRRVRDDK